MSDRRDKSERRANAERRRLAHRRKGDLRVVAIELTADELRIADLQRAATEGAPDLVSAATVPWRFESTGLHTAEGMAELTTALREVARGHALHGAEVRIVLSGEFCVLRTIRGAVEEVRAELQQLEQRSRLYLSLGPGEKVLVAHTRSLDARHAYSLAAVCNRATLDAVAGAAEAAGIEASVIEPGLTALHRAVCRLPEVPADPYLLVNFNRAAMEVGVCHQGQLLLDYRPGGRTKIDDLPALLESHLTRLSRHVGRHLRVAPPELNHLFLSGDDETVAAAEKQFKQRTQLEIRRVRPQDVRGTWQFRDHAGTLVTAASLGSLLASYLSEAESDAPNLMLHILERKREPLRPRLIRSMVPLAATLLVSLGLSLVNAHHQRELDTMQAELDGLAAVENRANELRLQLASFESKLRELDRLADQLPTTLGGSLVQRFAQCMPSDVWLTRLELLDRRIARLEGASYQEAGVYDYVRWLEQAPGLMAVALKRTNPSASASGPTTSFELEVNLEDPDGPVTKVARHE